MSESTTIKTPILLMVCAIALALLITGLTLGVMSPLGFVLVGLSMVWFGIWLLLNQDSKTSRVCACVLIASPVIGVYLMFFTVMFL